MCWNTIRIPLDYRTSGNGHTGWGYWDSGRGRDPFCACLQTRVIWVAGGEAWYAVNLLAKTQFVLATGKVLVCCEFIC